MALINCPECGKEISDSAAQCIHCGYSLKPNVSIVEKAKKKLDKKVLIGIGAALVVVLIVVFVLVYKNSIVPAKNYDLAEQTLQNEEYDDAAAQFEALGDYKDSEERVLECYYEKGKSLMAKGSYSAAIKAFEEADNYADAANQISKAEDKLAEEEAAAEKQAVIDLLKEAYDNCSSYDTSLSSDGLSLYVDSEDENDMEGLTDIISIISTLGLPDSVFDEMCSTTALMGKQTQVCGDYEVSWSYHPDNGLDAIFKVIQ